MLFVTGYVIIFLRGDILKNALIDINIFASRFYEALNESKYNTYTIADKLNLSPATISRYTNGKMLPKLATLYQAADILNVSPEWLMGKSDIKSVSHISTKAIKIPVLGTVVAGVPLEAVEEILDYEEISVQMARNGEYFALKVKGDSMEPKISAGDVVIVRKQSDVDSGEIAIVLVNGDEATIKKVTKFEGGINLIPNNPAYEVITYTNEQIESLPVRVIGKVVELRAKF